MKKKIAVLGLIGIVVVLVTIQFLNRRTASDDTVRHLETGAVIGFEDQANTHAWLGIPFAQPPVGELRWAAPRPLKPWNGVREALDHAAMCSQVIPFKWPKRIIKMGDEDCLYLDVWSPRLQPKQLEKAKLPVMVWIHGGANTLGMSGATRSYNLAGKQNVIVVSLQYRLGFLGWFSHPALRNSAQTPEDATSNFAILDMIAALQWVQNNIAAFGGDPDNVTLFGQSAGAFNVYALVASPLAKGLFHRAIAQSGNMQTVPVARSENYIDDTEPGLPYSSREFINRQIIADDLASGRLSAKRVQDQMTDAELVAYLRGKSVEDLLRSIDKRTGLGYFNAANIRDGYALPDKPLLEVFADPEQYNDVPMIIGSNRDEYKFFLWIKPEFSTKQFGILPKLKNVKEYNRISAYFSDQWQAVGVNEPAAVLSRNRPDGIFSYRFDWAGQKTVAGIDMATLFGASHGIEMTFIYGPEAVDTLSLFAMAEREDAREDLSNTMMSYWATFARTGNPGNSGNPQQPLWQPWQQDGPKKLILNQASGGWIRMSDETISVAQLKDRLRHDPDVRSTKDRCELYAQLFFYAMSTDFWSDEEYEALGCHEYPVEVFGGII